MQFEEFDKKFKTAADHHYPAYDENAWKKMKVLLDKHLPQREENRRRILFFLLFLGLLGGGGWLFMEKPWKQGAVSNNQPVKGKDRSAVGIRQSTTGNWQTRAGIPAGERPASSQHPLVDKKIHNNLIDQLNLNSPGPKNSVVVKEEKEWVNNPGIDLANKVPAPEIEDAGVKERITGNNIVTENITADKKSDLTGEDDKEQQSEKKETQAGNTFGNNKKRSPAARSGFMFSLSAGPDISAVGSRLGKIKLLVGAGIGYSFNNRLSLRTGFYTARKVYTASEDQYKPDQPLTYPYLDHIDADCKIYEIPVTLSYQLNKTGKNNWFAGAGLSSLLMKKESYDYVYKYPNGTSYTHNNIFRDKNNHFFSVLSLSGGYSRELSSSSAISIEPYLRLPLTGIGDGNVRLNSGGVMLSFQLKPFKGKSGPPK